MATTQTIKVTLQRDSLQTSWGFRLQGGVDFRSPFIVNKISACSPADGNLHRGDVILEIDHTPISSMLHTDALELIQRAGGQITFLIQRGSELSSLTSSVPRNQRPMSAISWSHESSRSPWSPSTHQLTPMSFFRNRPLERIPEPKPLLSQTGSPMMPGPVPSVSTKTRGYMQPPSFHSDRLNDFNNNSYSPVRLVYPGPTYNHRNRAMSTANYPNTLSPSWTNSFSNESESYTPTYQKKVQINPYVQKQYYNPSSPQSTNLVHRQFNSPMSLYSNDNVQEVMNHHISRVNPMNQNEFVTDF
ncbi:hypothetical protein I4U23_025772 [Adineta vaga]|nr:hypothetical protein I4U23_025772 [Adineta vaga]